MNVSDEVWMRLYREYLIIRIVQKLYSINKKNCSYLIVTGDVLFNLRNNECEYINNTQRVES